MMKFVPRIHYRLVTDTAGYPLSSFKGSRELLETTYDAFIGKKSRLQFTCPLQSSAAVMDAHEKAETLHCNVSLPNIILYSKCGRLLAVFVCSIQLYWIRQRSPKGAAARCDFW